MKSTKLDLFIRTFIWLAFIALWTFLSKREGFSLLAIRPGLPMLLGAGLITIGIGLYIWSARLLAAAAPISRSAPVKLVKHGPYRYVRNPLYLAIAAVLAGVSTLYGAWDAAGLMRTAIVGLCVHLRVILHEEPVTRRQFGEAYEDYCRAVPRWVPRWPKSSKQTIT